MGREIRRVPLDFDWPLNERWKGFVNPHYIECEACGGRGSTKSSLALERIVHLMIVAGEDSFSGPRPGRTWPHPWITEAGIEHPGDNFHELTTALAGRSPAGRLGHDAIDRWSIQKKIVEAAGLPENWGWCKICDGEGTDPAHREAYEAWEQTEPPEGEGWQVWETVSEGSPITKPFPTAEELIDHLVNVGTVWGQKYSREGATAFVNSGHAFSMEVRDGEVIDGVEACAKK